MSPPRKHTHARKVSHYQRFSLYHSNTPISFGLSVSADNFQDVKSTDEYAAAINLCFSLGIVNGMSPEVFDALGDVTREQFTKFIYVLMNGKDDEAALYKGQSPFGDVAAERWSAGYINWAKSRNIVAGRDAENTVFDPEAKVTFAEASKMFVVALGYDVKNFTFPYGFIDKAQSLGLFKDVKGYAVNAAANRGQVSQMTFNGLYADAPYFGSYQAAVGSSSSATTTKLYTPLEKAFGITEHTTSIAVLNATSNYALDTGFTKAGQVNISTPSMTASFDYAGNVDSLVGSSVRVFYKDLNGTATGFDAGDLVVDIQEGKSNKQYNFKPGDVKTSGSTTTTNSKLFVSVDGATREFIWNVGATSGSNTVVVDSLGTPKNNVVSPIVSSDFSKETGNTFKAIDQNGDNTIDRIIVTENATAQVISVDTLRLTLSNLAPAASPVGYVGAKDLKATDAQIIKIADGVAKDTWVNVSAVKSFTSNNKMETIYSVAPTTVLTNATLGKVEGGTGIASTKYYFDNTAKTLAAAGFTIGTVSFSASTDVGNKYNLVFNNNGYIVKRDIATSLTTGSWLYVKNTENYTDNAGNPKTAALNVIMSDGTSRRLPVSSDLKRNGASVGIVNLSSTAGTAMSFALNSSNEIVELNDQSYVVTTTGYNNGGGVQGTVPAGTAVYNKDTNVFSGVGLSGYNTTNTVVFFEGTQAGVTKYGAMIGTDLNSINIAGYNVGYSVNAGLRRDDKSFAVVVVKSATTNIVPTKTADKAALLMNVIKENIDGKYVYTFKVAYDGKVEEVKTAPLSTANANWDTTLDLLRGSNTYGYYTLQFNAAGQISDIVPVAEGTSNQERATVLLDRVLTGALVGEDIGAQTYTYSSGASVKYQLKGSGTSFTGTLADTVNYYLVNSTPVVGSTATIANTADGGKVAKTASVTVADKSILQESSTTAGGLAYVADVVYNNDGKVSAVYFYAQPVLRAFNSGTDLSGIVITPDAGSLSGFVFAPGTYSYTATVTNSTASVTVTPTGISAQTITVNGVNVASGSASASIALSAGVNTITVVATEPDAATRTYTITINKGVAVGALPAGTYAINSTAGENVIWTDDFGDIRINNTTYAGALYANEIKALMSVIDTGNGSIKIDANGQISAVAVTATKTIDVARAGFASTVQVVGNATNVVTVTGNAGAKNFTVVGNTAGVVFDSNFSTTGKVTLASGKLTNSTGANLTVSFDGSDYILADTSVVTGAGTTLTSGGAAAITVLGVSITTSGTTFAVTNNTELTLGGTVGALTAVAAPTATKITVKAAASLADTHFGNVHFVVDGATFTQTSGSVKTLTLVDSASSVVTTVLGGKINFDGQVYTVGANTTLTRTAAKTVSTAQKATVCGIEVTGTTTAADISVDASNNVTVKTNHADNVITVLNKATANKLVLDAGSTANTVGKITNAKIDFIVDVGANDGVAIDTSTAMKVDISGLVGGNTTVVKTTAANVVTFTLKAGTYAIAGAATPGMAAATATNAAPIAGGIFNYSIAPSVVDMLGTGGTANTPSTTFVDIFVSGGAGTVFTATATLKS